MNSSGDIFNAKTCVFNLKYVITNLDPKVRPDGY